MWFDGSLLRSNGVWGGRLGLSVAVRRARSARAPCMRLVCVCVLGWSRAAKCSRASQGGKGGGKEGLSPWSGRWWCHRQLAPARSCGDACAHVRMCDGVGPCLCVCRGWWASVCGTPFVCAHHARPFGSWVNAAVTSTGHHQTPRTCEACDRRVDTLPPAAQQQKQPIVVAPMTRAPRPPRRPAAPRCTLAPLGLLPPPTGGPAEQLQQRDLG
jgi:hypothetical protein